MFDTQSDAGDRPQTFVRHFEHDGALAEVPTPADILVDEFWRLEHLSALNTCLSGRDVRRECP